MLTEILDFLPCETPEEWIHCALKHQDLLLVDHANCEKKAASTAMNLLYRHVDRPDLLQKMSQLAREELLHFQQVVSLMNRRGIRYGRLSASRYAAALREHVRSANGSSLVDTLIVGALVEARSCERFARLAPLLDDELGRFYRSLLKSEARHFQDYLALAQSYSGENIDPQIARFVALEQELILSGDSQFRFHSGRPEASLLREGVSLA